MSETPPPGARVVDAGGPHIPRPWDKLSQRQRARVELLLSKLMEIEAGTQHTSQLAQQVPQPEHPLNRFMFNSLIQYLHGCFMAGSAGVQDVLRSVDLIALAEQIDKRLALPVGTHTLKTFIDEHRNTLLAHPSFDPKAYVDRVAAKADLRDETVRQRFFASLDELGVLTRFIHRFLRESYPIAASREDARWKPVDNPLSSSP